jgi:hypothetical protein
VRGLFLMACAVRGACPVTRISNFPHRVRASVRKVEVSNEPRAKENTDRHNVRGEDAFHRDGQKVSQHWLLKHSWRPTHDAAGLPWSVHWNRATRKTHGQRLLDVTDGNLMLESEQPRLADPRTTKADYTKKPIDRTLNAMGNVG